MSGARHPGALSDADLIAAIRAQLESELSCVQVPKRLGDRSNTQGKHRMIEIMGLQGAPTDSTYPSEALMGARREIELRWWVSYLEAVEDSATDDGDHEALSFADDIVCALVGPFDWSITHRTEWLGQRPAFVREGNWYRGEIRIVSTRSKPQGGHS